MKKNLFIVWILMLPLAASAYYNPLQNFPTTSGGAGIEDSPYLIKNVDDLRTLMSDVNAGITYEGVYFKVTDDIDFKDEPQGELGNFVSMNGFKGIFDGNGKRLKNIINTGYLQSNWYYAGIFQKIENAVVKNVIIDESCSFTKGAFIASAINSTITGCVNYANVTGSGIVGYCNSCQISECINHGDIKTTMVGEHLGYGSGGIVGHVNKNTTISKCKNYGNFSPCDNSSMGETRDIGGIVGYNYGSAVEDCENYGNFDGTLSSVGGIVGTNQVWDSWDPQYEGYGSASIKRCNNYGNFSIYGAAAGIVYYNEGSWHPDGEGSYFQVECEISDCTNKGDVESSNASASGIVCNNQYASIIGCTNEGSVKSTGAFAGGIAAASAGKEADDGTIIWAKIKDCENKGEVIVLSAANYAYAGGIVGSPGYSTSHEIVNCKNSGHVTGYKNAGGIAGDGSTIMLDCFNSGNVTALRYDNSANAGAIAGGDYNDYGKKNNYYDSKVIVTSDGKELKGAMSRGCCDKDIAKDNGAVMNTFTIEAQPQGNDYWTTFFKNESANYQADENTTVYTAKRVLRELYDGTKVYRLLLTEVPDRIIKGCGQSYENLGVILKSSKSQITMTLTAEEPSEAAYSYNVLGGCDHPIESDGDDFVLTTGEKFGFIKFTGTELPANSAYTSSYSSYWPELVELELDGKVLYHIESGDLNDDGLANLSDRRLMVNAIMTGSYDDINVTMADMNEDGKVNASDLVLLVNKMNMLVQREESGYYLIGDHNGWNMTDKSYAFKREGSRSKGYYWVITVPSENMGCFKIAPASAFDNPDTFWSNLLCAEEDRCTELTGTIVKGDFGAWLLDVEGATSYTIRIVPSKVSYEIIAQ